MTADRIDHIALIVESLHQAENLYRALFRLEVRQREGWTALGVSSLLPVDCDCRALSAGGAVIGRSLLARDGLRLVLQQGAPDMPTGGRLAYIGLCCDMEEQRMIRLRASELGCRVLSDLADCLCFEDTLGVRWQLTSACDF